MSLLVTMIYPASIVIPLLNQRNSWLKQCVLSSLHQTVRTETLVVISPATLSYCVEGLDELGRQYRDLRVLMEEGKGFAAALNTGIRAVSASRIGFLLSDDWLHEDAARECLNFHTDIVSTGLNGYAADGRTRLEAVCREPSLEAFHQQPTLERQASYLQHFLFFKRDILLKVGGVDATVGLTGPDDFDLIWTLLEHGASVSVIGKALYNYRDHTEARLSLRSREAQIRDLCIILDKHAVHGQERQDIIAWHALSYGQPVQVTEEARKGLVPPGNRIQQT